MNATTQRTNWPLTAVLVVAAAALGFGVSRWQSGKGEARALPAAQATAPTAAASAAEGDGIAEVRIPPEYLAAARIAVQPVASGSADAEVLAPGTVVAPPNSEAVVVARVAGTVTRVLRQVGDSVRAGDVLAQVQGPEAATLAAEARAAQARLELARKSHAREARLFEQGVTPRQELEAAQAALALAEAEAQRTSGIARGAHLAADGLGLSVVSPIAGRLSAQAVTLGAYVLPQTELFRVAGGGTLHVEASVPAADLASIKPGDGATVLAQGQAPVEAVVRAVSPAVSGGARAASVVLVPKAAASGLVLGAGVQVRLHTKVGGSQGLVVPEEAVQNIDGRDVLFVRTKDGFSARPVLVGSRSHGVALIVTGVKAGDLVATQNAFLVKADMIKNAKD